MKELGRRIEVHRRIEQKVRDLEVADRLWLENERLQHKLDLAEMEIFIEWKVRSSLPYKRRRI
jgi:hypothetical protein